MRPYYLSPVLALFFAAGHAAAECPSMRLGYVDHHRAPYFLGTGSDEARPAGAAVDLVREAASVAGCKVTVVRLPQGRLRNALKTGAIDAMAMEAVDSDRDLYALPLDAAGNLDQGKALRVQMVVFVRAGDSALRNIDPAREFGQRWMGSNYAAPQVALLRKAGFKVDDGALDPERNLAKLMRKRIDGYAVSLASPGDLDKWVADKFGNAIVRLERPLQTNHIWLAMSKDYYARNPAQVNAMWGWMAHQGRQRFAKLVRKYDKQLAETGP